MTGPWLWLRSLMSRGKYAKRAALRKESEANWKEQHLKAAVQVEAAKLRQSEVELAEAATILDAITDMRNRMTEDSAEEADALRSEIANLVIEVGELRITEQQHKKRAGKKLLGTGIKATRLKDTISNIEEWLLESASPEDRERGIVLGVGVYLKRGLTVEQIERIQKVRGLR